MTTDAPDKLVISGLGKLDGEYPFDFLDLLVEGRPGSLTHRELHRIKMVTGLRAGEFEDAWRNGDNDLYIVLSLVILTRAGKSYDDDLLWDAKAGQLQIVLGEREEEDDVDPPVSEPPVSEQSEQPAQSGGDSSPSISVNQANGLSHIGPPALARSATSGLATSEI
jgi:hypothetical protein